MQFITLAITFQNFLHGASVALTQAHTFPALSALAFSVTYFFASGGDESEKNTEEAAQETQEQYKGQESDEKNVSHGFQHHRRSALEMSMNMSKVIAYNKKVRETRHKSCTRIGAVRPHSFCRCSSAAM